MSEEKRMECAFSHFAQTGLKGENIVVVKGNDGKFYDLRTNEKMLVDVAPDIKPGCRLLVDYTAPRKWAILDVIPPPEPAPVVPKEEPPAAPVVPKEEPPAAHVVPKEEPPAAHVDDEHEEEDEEEWTREELEELTKDDLKALCIEHQLKTSGNKPNLVDRILSS